jgi:hypothetical protein
MVFIPDTIKGGGAWKTPDTPEELMGNLGQMFTDSLS